MTVITEAESTHQPAKEANEASSFNLYPALGVVLLLALATTVYGGLLIFVLEEWALLEPAVQGGMRG